MQLRFRQIHLDFHTSEHITGIGSGFDPDEFADTLAKAHVNSVTCFARCHHGWLYYDSKADPDRVHRHLERNLLKEQIDACHARDIRVPIYTTIQWDHLIARQHPEWLTLTPDGCVNGQKPYEAGFYGRLAVNSPYMDFLKSHVRELLDLFEVDGFFFDIVAPLDDSSVWTRSAMLEAGLNPADGEARRAFGFDVINNFRRELTAFVRQSNTECTIFYNQGHVGPQHRVVKDAYSHWELESLASGGWGYLHFPLSMRYARTLGKECLGMNGKFHTSWGDFHSFKNPAALQFECFRFLAFGAKSSVGDQLPPNGKIDPYVYDLISSVYGEIEAKEPWCVDVTPLADIGVVTPEAFATSEIRAHPSLMGINRMLEEGGHQFDVLDAESDLSGYKVIVLPDEIPVEGEFADKLTAYVQDGGAVIASFESGMNAAKTRFDLVGVNLVDEGPRDLDGQLVRGRHFPSGDYLEYVLAGEALGAGLYPTEYAMYMRGMAVEAVPDAEVLAQVVPSYFDRTYQHFCSHRQTPSAGGPTGPAVVRSGNVIYFSHPIFRQYNQNAPRWCKTLFLNALNLLLPEPLVRHDGPSTVLAALNEQTAENRRVLHLLHYIPERRGQDFDIIEDVIPLYDLAVSVRVPGTVSAVTVVPDGDALDFEQTDGRVDFVLPRLHGHEMVELNFG
jgi:hypothetical protein